jgi:S1-C subfamily serine protease
VSQLSGGVLVAGVDPRGPAASAGIKSGDLIVTVNKTAVANTDDLATALAELKPGMTIPVVVMRNGKKLTFHVKLGELKSG